MGHEDVLVGDEKHRPGRFKEKSYLLEDPHQLREELERFKMRHEKQAGENGRSSILRPAKVEPQKPPSPVQTSCYIMNMVLTACTTSITRM